VTHKQKKAKISKKSLTKVMKDIDFCMMTTKGARGALHSRPMSNNRNVAFSGETWFFSYTDSSQVRELKRDNSVTLNYAVPDKILFVSLEGKADTIKDETKKKELWYDDLARWFPDGPEDKKLVLIRVKATLVRYWGKDGEGELTL
jgi:general stress protein 26